MRSYCEAFTAVAEVCPEDEKNDQNYHCWSSKKKKANTMMVGQVDKTHPKIVRSRSTSRLKRFNGSQEMMNTMITEASR